MQGGVTVTTETKPLASQSQSTQRCVFKPVEVRFCMTAS